MGKAEEQPSHDESSALTERKNQSETAIMKALWSWET